MTSSQRASKIEIRRRSGEGGPFARLAEDVRRGLTKTRKELPPKYFYDARATVSARAKATKPYFDVVDERLVLRNRPVPPPEEDMDAFRRVFGYSHLADKLMNRIDPTYWQAGPVERAHDRGLVVSCLLMERLRRLGHARQMPVLVVAQPSKRGDLDTRVSDIVLGCARDAGLAALDLFPAFRGVRDESPGRYQRFFFGHMTPSGNRFVAGHIAASIRRDALLD